MKMLSIVLISIALVCCLSIKLYSLSYLFVTLYMAISFFKVSYSHKYVVGFIFIYLSISLLNISTWRGYTDIEVINLYMLCVFALTLPMQFKYERKVGVGLKDDSIYNMKLFLLIMMLHLFIAYIAVFYVYVTKGIILTNQSLRFGLSTEISYVIKSVLPLAAFVPLMKIKRKNILLALIVMPAVLIGSRGTAVMAILSYVIVDVFKNNKKYDFNWRKLNSKYSFYVIASLSVIFIGFYVRRSGGDLATVTEVVGFYFDYDNFLIRMILPLYLGFKETIGLTNYIVVNEITNYVNDHALFWADLYTVLPGERLAAGQSLSIIAGSVQSGGLTPGLVGGIFIDYRYWVIGVFFLIGSIFFLLDRKLQLNPLYIVVYSQVITQFVHLFHRGFLKPEYFTSILIALFYYFLCHRIIFKAN